MAYIDNSEFEARIAAYRAGDRDVAEDLGRDFLALARGLSGYWRRRWGDGSLPDPDDAVADAVYTCLNKIGSFKSGHGKAFNFFTAVVLNSWRCDYQVRKRVLRGQGEYLRHLGREVPQD